MARERLSTFITSFNRLTVFFAFPQASGSAKVRRPAPSDRPAKLPAPTLRQRGPGEREGGAHEPYLHDQRMTDDIVSLSQYENIRRLRFLISWYRREAKSQPFQWAPRDKTTWWVWWHTATFFILKIVFNRKKTLCVIHGVPIEVFAQKYKDIWFCCII